MSLTLSRNSPAYSYSSPITSSPLKSDHKDTIYDMEVRVPSLSLSEFELKNLSDKFSSKLDECGSALRDTCSTSLFRTKVVLLLELKHSSSGNASLKESVGVI
jgi:hypothetical protein